MAICIYVHKMKNPGHFECLCPFLMIIERNKDREGIFDRVVIYSHYDEVQHYEEDNS